MKYKRIYEVLNPQELSVIKLSFDTHGIEYRTLFEHTLQIANVYALGNTGAIIEVTEEDYDRAKDILVSHGIELDYHVKLDRFKFIEWIDNATSKVKWIGKLPLVKRVFIVISCALGIPTLFVLLNMNRIAMNELKGNFWCVERVIFNGKRLYPNTTSGLIIIGGWQEKCKEEIYFSKEDGIILPGFNTYGSRGSYKRHWNTLVVENLDEHREIYVGEYRIRTNWWGTMKFVSPTTTIVISRKN